MSILSKDLLVRNNSGDRGSTAAYTVYTVNTVYAVDMVDTVYTILTAIQCVNSSMYAYIYTVMTTSTAVANNSSTKVLVSVLQDILEIHVLT